MNPIKSILISLMAVTLLAETIPVSSALDINNAMSELQPGDTLLMTNGIWNNQAISFHAVGTDIAPIVLIAETPGQVMLTGTSSLVFSGAYIEINGLDFREGYSTGSDVIQFRRNGVRANHCRLTNSSIFNYNPSSITTNYKWVSIYGQHNQVDHCYFAGKNHDGTTLVIWLQEAQDRENQHIIEYNYFGQRPPLGFNGGETIRIGTSDYSMTNSRSIVRHNLFEQCDGEIEIISNKSCENIYFNNTFINNEGTLTLRHGNRCLVDGNFFFGAGNSDAGGVRIIGTDHIVINNYFEGLPASGYRSAITLVKGVENSPLNRYFQVENALVAFNTIINCRQSILMGYGSSDDQTLPPVNCTIGNNAIDAGNNTVFYTGDTEGLPQNFTYLQNIVMGSSLGIPDTSAGIIWQDPLFDFPISGLVRPSSASPLIGQAAQLSYDVTSDMDGHLRGLVKDIGADQVSDDPILYRPLTRDDVGPDWLFTQTGNQYVAAGLNTLADAVDGALPGDTLFLTGGDYELSRSVTINREIIILPDVELTIVPLIRPGSDLSSISTLFEIQGGGQLNISGVIIDGGGITSNTAQRIFHANSLGSPQVYSLKLRNVTFQNIGRTGDLATLLEGAAGSVADSINLKYCTVRQVNGPVFTLDNTADGSGQYSARNMLLEDCTFWDISGSVLQIYGGDSNPFSVGPLIVVDQCSFHACGSSEAPVINARDVDVATIRNSIFTSCSVGGNLAELYNWSQILYSDIYDSGDLSFHGAANAGPGMLALDPLYLDASMGQFILTTASPLYDHPGSNGAAYGDRRCHDPGVIQSIDPQSPDRLLSMSAYPNPFNGSTRLKLNFDQAGYATLQIYDLRGRQVLEPVTSIIPSGARELPLQLDALDSGVYLCTLSFEGSQLVTKLTVLK